MKALTLIGPREVAVTRVPEPSSPNGVLLRVEMVGLCGSDLNSYRGNNPMVTYPRILGHEIAATVVDGTSRFPAGTTVTVSPYTSCGSCSACMLGRVNCCQFNQTMGVQRDGALCEWIRVPEEKLYTSSTLGLREMALVEPLTVGFHAIARGRISMGEFTAVYGCGGVGLGAIAGASFRGARTIAIDQDETKLEIARAAGADYLINARSENVSERLREITDGTGPSVIVEAIGLPETFRSAVEDVAFAGRVVYIGYAKQPVAYETKLFVQKEVDILGSRNALPEDFHSVITMLESGSFPVNQAITDVVTMEDTPGSISRWAAAPASVSKLLVKVGS